MEPLSKAKFKLVQNLSKKTFRIKHNLYIVEGYTMVQELLNKYPEQIEFVVVTDKYQGLKTSKPKYSLIDKDFELLSNLQTPDGILAVCKMPNNKLDLKAAKRIVILNDISDPGNLGTIIRTANWFSASCLLLTKNSVDCYNPKVVQASMGSLFRLPIFYIEDLEATISQISKDNFSIIGLSLNGNSNPNTDKTSKVALLFGSESHGIPANIESKINYLYKIPGNPDVESLNLSISAGIAMHQFFN